MKNVQLTLLRNLLGPLSKAFALQDGKLEKSAAANLTQGIATKCAVEGLHGLAGIIDKLTSEEALTFGVCRYDRVRVVTQNAKHDGTVCRDRDHFSWPSGRGVLMLDIDRPRDGAAPLRAHEFDALMCKVQPWWSSVARMYRPSASAFIYDTAGNELVGGGSLRCYAIIDIAENIPFVGVDIADAFWRAGHGRIESSKVDSMLVRCPVDCAVWQPERLDFAGPVVLGPGLCKRSYPPLILPGSDIDSEAVLRDGIGKMSFGDWSYHSEDVERAKAVHRPEEKRRKKQVIEKRVQEDVAKGVDASTSREKWTKAIEDSVLSGAYELHFVDGVATVRDVLRHPVRFNLKRLADPEDPDYAKDPRIAVFYANTGTIFSHAHGGKKYILTENSSENRRY